MQIPDKLKNNKIRFIKIKEGTKQPIEKNWETTKNYSYEEIKESLKSVTACGILCGEKSNDLAVIDCDRKELASVVLMGLPSTFTVETGSKGYHMYYFIHNLEAKIVLQNDKGHFGEVQFSKSQVISPNSLHPNKNFYSVVHDNEIATITKEQLLKTVEPYMKKEKKTTFSISKGFNLDISKVASLIPGLDINGAGEMQGKHPIHSSSKGEKGNNFSINLEKNVWKCFRHETGGDSLYLIAMLEGLINCEDIKPNYFKANPKVLF